jgi:hypothetical protein
VASESAFAASVEVGIDEIFLAKVPASGNFMDVRCDSCPVKLARPREYIEPARESPDPIQSLSLALSLLPFAQPFALGEFPLSGLSLLVIPFSRGVTGSFCKLSRLESVLVRPLCKLSLRDSPLACLSVGLRGSLCMLPLRDSDLACLGVGLSGSLVRKSNRVFPASGILYFLPSCNASSSYSLFPSSESEGTRRVPRLIGDELTSLSMTEESSVSEGAGPPLNSTPPDGMSLFGGAIQGVVLP